MSVAEGYCHCGCGEKTKIYRGEPRKFVKGHHARVACNPRFGVILTEEVKTKISISNKGKQIGEKNPFYGKNHTLEAKQKMSEKGKGIAKTPRKGLYKNCMFCQTSFYVPQYLKEKKIYCGRKCQTEDYKSRFSGQNNPFYGKSHTNEIKEEIRQSTLNQRAAGVFLPTKPEQIIHKRLNEKQIYFETEKIVNAKFCVDIFIPKFNLIIFVDGCYWHACPKHFPKAQKPNTDNARLPYLTKCGYNVEIFWEHDIKTDSEKLVENICQKYNTL